MEVEGDHLVKEGNSQSGTKEGLARSPSISRTTLPTLDFRLRSILDLWSSGFILCVFPHKLE